MKFKYTPVSTISYAEEGQPNPIRWALVSKTEEGFKNETNWFRCKDFLNDFCVAYNGGPKFAIYGFNTASLNIPTKGGDVLLVVAHLTEAFTRNLGVFNDWLETKKLPQIQHTPIDPTMVVLHFPEFFFSNTHHVSLVTLVIRLLNAKTIFASFEEVIACKTFPPQDQNKWSTVVTFGKFFSLPEKLKEFTWYCNSTNNSKTFAVNSYSLSSLIHNNGCLSWLNAIKQEELNAYTYSTAACEQSKEHPMNEPYKSFLDQFAAANTSSC